MKSPLVLGITIGDVGGIGPEVALKALHQVRWPVRYRFVLVGSGAVLDGLCRQSGWPRLRRWTPRDGVPADPVMLWEPVPCVRLRPHPGCVRADAARAAVAWIRAATQACLAGTLDAMITAPICKEGLLRAGIDVPGHTELLADLTRTRHFAMMLMGGPLRVVLATRHVPLARVPRVLTAAGIIEAGELAAEAIEWLGLRARTLGVCGLNPHAGDGGAIGREEIQMIGPAVRELRRRGHAVEGPVPADVIFHQARHGAYGAVVAMYHDQGLGPLKTLAFDTGVNLTLGLPIVRTSPDHGTAFDIAGKGIANAASMIAAIRMAARLASRSNPWARPLAS